MPVYMCAHHVCAWCPQVIPFNLAMDYPLLHCTFALFLLLLLLFCFVWGGVEQAGCIEESTLWAQVTSVWARKLLKFSELRFVGLKMGVSVGKGIIQNPLTTSPFPVARWLA